MSISSARTVAGGDGMMMAAAAKITVAYTGIYSMTMIHQVVTKKGLHRKLGDTFDRYNSIYMRNADRFRGNFLEWSLLFL